MFLSSNIKPSPNVKLSGNFVISVLLKSNQPPTVKFSGNFVIFVFLKSKLPSTVKLFPFL